MSDDLPVMAEGLEVNESEDGVVIFDASTDRVHHLNNTAALVLELCDGKRGIEQIAELLGDAFGLDEPPVTESRQCLARLQAQGLVS
jgi:hypothetical protein